MCRWPSHASQPETGSSDGVSSYSTTTSSLLRLFTHDRLLLAGLYRHVSSTHRTMRQVSFAWGSRAIAICGCTVAGMSSRLSFASTDRPV